MSNNISIEGADPRKIYRVSASKTTAIAKGDAVWESADVTGPIAVSAKDFTFQGDIAKTRRLFKAKFLGFADDISPAASNTPRGTVLTQDYIAVVQDAQIMGKLDAAAAADVDDLITLAEHADGSKLDPGEVITTTDETAAIGRVSRIDAGSEALTTKTKVLFYTKGLNLKELGGPKFAADTGAGGVIPIAAGMDVMVELEIAGVEIGTVPNATWPGQRLGISCRAKSGTSRTLTFAAAINSTGNNTALFDAVGETLFVQAGSDLKWVEVGIKGCTLSTV